MYLSKIGPVAALVLSGVALCLLALAPLGWRFGLWRYGFGLYWLMPASAFVAAVAVILCVLTLARAWLALPPRGLAVLFIALAGRSARLCACAVLAHARQRSTHSRHYHRHR
jgi:hypothetical protein